MPGTSTRAWSRTSWPPRRCAREGRLGVGDDGLGARVDQRLVVAEPRIDVRRVGEPEEGSRDLAVLVLELGDLVEPDLVNLLGGVFGEEVRPHHVAVDLEAAREVAQPGLLVGAPLLGEVAERRAVGREAGADRRRDDRSRAPAPRRGGLGLRSRSAPPGSTGAPRARGRREVGVDESAVADSWLAVATRPSAAAARAASARTSSAPGMRRSFRGTARRAPRS